MASVGDLSVSWPVAASSKQVLQLTGSGNLLVCAAQASLNIKQMGFAGLDGKPQVSGRAVQDMNTWQAGGETFPSASQLAMQQRIRAKRLGHFRVNVDGTGVFRDQVFWADPEFDGAV